MWNKWIKDERGATDIVPLLTVIGTLLFVCLLMRM